MFKSIDGYDEYLKHLGQISKPQGEGIGFKIDDDVVGLGYVSNGKRYVSDFYFGTTRTVLLQPNKMALAPNMVDPGDYPFIPTAPTAVQLSSSDVLDVTDYTFIVVGLDLNYNIITEFITLTGQTPAVGTVEFLRLKGIQLVTTDAANVPGASTHGSVYVTVAGLATITLGVPDSASDIMCSTFIGTGIGNPGYFTVPPGKRAYPSELLFSVGVAGKVAEIDIAVHVRSGSQTRPWNCVGEFWVQSVQPTAYIRNHAFTNIVSDSTGPTDIMCFASRTSGNINDSDVGVIMQMALILVGDA